MEGKERTSPFPKLALFLGLLAVGGCARGLGPPRPPSDEMQRSWARQALAGMSLEEKVGQMILARSSGSFLHERDPALMELEGAVEEGRIGGVVFFKGEPYATAALANRLQLKAKLPLLMAADYEWGAAFRVKGATRFPSAMALGAGGKEEDVRFQAEVTAREARAMGIHLALAPVVDLNVNPANSVINYRSFGEDPERVGRLAAAFIRRGQEVGLLTVAKHFPGHGATSADSHLTLPVLSLSRKRLEEVELVPFRAAIEAGVAAVMPAHLAVPALDGRDDRPATFSREILGGVLRGQMGFTGLIVTDALDMGGARERWWGGEVAVKAVLAGSDLLLLPSEPRVAWDAVRRAVRRGEISRRQIDASVMRILEAKARVNLHRQRTVDLRDLPRFVGDPRFRRRVQDIADRSVTLLSQRPGTLPLRAERPPRMLLVDYVLSGDPEVDSSALVDELEARTESLARLHLTCESVEVRLPTLAMMAEEADVVVVASFVRTRSSLGRGEMTPGLSSALSSLTAQGKPVVMVSLGNPYVLTAFSEASALIAAYDFSAVSQRAVARALFGEIEISGRLPVGLSERYPVGHGMDLDRRKMELETVDSLEGTGFSREGMTRAVRVLRDAVRWKAFPGAVAVVGRRSRLVLVKVVGRLGFERDFPRVTTGTIYDLASLTKVLATTTIAMILYERGELDLERRVRDYIPEFHGGDKDRVTVADLLAHSGGLLSQKDFYKDLEGQTPDQAKKSCIDAICRLPLDYPPRSKSVYSDLGFLLLGEILERVAGRPLDELARDEIFEPLGMVQTLYNPPASLRDRVAPTEQDPWRGRMLRGEVHDENAFALGGVAPHAGLFSTAGDVARFAQMMLNGGIYGTTRILNRSTIERFTGDAGPGAGDSRALGWDRPSGESSAGRYFSASSFGHTGFTGTSLWIDPDREIFVVLLTNRVHPARDNERIREVRPAFHDAVMEAIKDIEIAPREP